MISVSETTVKIADLLLKNFTAVAPARLVPLMVTAEPIPPLVGEKREDGLNLKMVALVPVPPEFVTVIGPLVAKEGTVAVILVEEFITNDVACVPLNATAVSAR